MSRDEEKLLRELAMLSREESDESFHADEKWDSLAEDSCTDEELAKLQQLAQSDPNAKVAHELFSPFTDDFRNKLAQSATQELKKGESEDLPGNVVELASRQNGKKKGIPGWVVPVVASAAAAVALIAVLPLIDTDQNGGSRLPGYSVSVTGNVKGFRGSQDEASKAIPRYSRETFIDVLLRPKQPVENEIWTASFYEASGKILPISISTKIAEQGVVRLRGKVTELKLPEGKGRIWVAIGKPDRRPQSEEIIKHIKRQGTDKENDYLLLHVDIQVVPE